MKYYYRQWIKKETPANISVNGKSMRTTSAVESSQPYEIVDLLRPGGILELVSISRAEALIEDLTAKVDAPGSRLTNIEKAVEMLLKNERVGNGGHNDCGENDDDDNVADFEKIAPTTLKKT